MSQEPREVLDLFLDRYGPFAGEEGPVRFVQEQLESSPDPWQERLLRAYGRGERRMSVRSCHGPGKTACAAWIIVHSLTCRFPQNTVVTAPSKGQLEDALVKEVKKWFQRLPKALQANFEVTTMRIEFIPNREESFFSARTARAETPEALQGVHCEPGYVLLVADEASGVPEPVFEAAAGSMSGHHAQTLLLSNPTRNSGFFYDTHHKLKDMWFTEHVSHKDSPRVTEDFVHDIARRYGEESNAFRIRCEGEFPLADDDTVIPYTYIASAQERQYDMPHAGEIVWGVDIARFGADKNALVKRRGNWVSPDIVTWSGVDLMQTAGRIKALYDGTPPSMRPVQINIDDIGMGGGVVDRLSELGLPVQGINVAEAPAAEDKYSRLRDELWFRGREFLGRLTASLPKPTQRDDPAELLAEELAAVKYKYLSSGKIQVEPKTETKKRMKGSPNVADAFLLTLAGDFITLMTGVSSTSKWRKPIKRDLRRVV